MSNMNEMTPPRAEILGLVARVATADCRQAHKPRSRGGAGRAEDPPAADAEPDGPSGLRGPCPSSLRANDQWRRCRGPGTEPFGGEQALLPGGAAAQGDPGRAAG